MEKVYSLGFNQAIKQVKYFFIGQKLNFTLLDPSKDVNEIKAKASQTTTLAQVQEITDKIQASLQLDNEQVSALEETMPNLAALTS